MYCLTLNIWRPSWILPTMQSHKVFSSHPSMSGVPTNPMVDNKITNLLLFCIKLYQFIVWLCTNGGPFGFRRHFFKFRISNTFFWKLIIEEYLCQISFFMSIWKLFLVTKPTSTCVNTSCGLKFMPKLRSWRHLGFMQIKNPPPKVFSPATKLNLFYRSM